jgi:hypothetical protein
VNSDVTMGALWVKPAHCAVCLKASSTTMQSLFPYCGSNRQLSRRPPSFITPRIVINLVQRSGVN